MKELALFFRVISICLVVLGLLYYLYVLICSRRNKLSLIKRDKKKPKFCILIPARNESKVIEALLISIGNQSYKVPFSDVYIIVESKADKTNLIASKYGANIIIRKNLNLKRKGYALDEGVKEIIKKHSYDAYFIFDADNVLDKNYFKNMLNTYISGYDIGIGYRNCKNGNDNVISACSALTFSMVNTISNKRKMKNHNTLTISGTGFYVTGYLIDEWKGYPFNSLTEDYELTLYATTRGLSTSYNEKAIFYDEQPTKYSVTKTQRVRWIRGYFDSRRKYIAKLREKRSLHTANYGSIISEIVGVKPFIMSIIGILFFILSDLMLMILNCNYVVVLFLILLVFELYTMLSLITLIIIIKERGKLDLNSSISIKAILFNPIYLFSYIPCAIKALVVKDVSWDRIDHNKN